MLDQEDVQFGRQLIPRVNVQQFINKLATTGTSSQRIETVHQVR